MNTIRSVGYGWGVLIVAGAGSYYFAKRQINADREARAASDEKRRQTMERLRAQEAVSREIAFAPRKDAKFPSNTDHPSPSREADADPAPIAHTAPERPKYEAREPYRSRKGDRFS